MPPPTPKKWHSEIGQDAFAYDFCGQRNMGTFLDLGSWHPWECNNSYSLEQLGWRGLLIDQDAAYERVCQMERKSPILISPAEAVDWKNVLPVYGFNSVIDYLSLDVEGQELVVLKNLAKSGFEFRAITCEHNAHSHGAGPRNAQREFLLSQGYTLTHPDKTTGTGLIFEDWWTKKI